MAPRPPSAPCTPTGLDRKAVGRPVTTTTDPSADRPTSLGPGWTIVGFLIGVLGSLILFAAALYGRAYWLARRPPPLFAHATATASVDVEAQFAEAEFEIYLGGSPARGSQLLNELTPFLSEKDELARAYQGLADAEMAQGSFHRAAAFYQQLYQYRPEFDVLLKIALAYDSAGALEAAVHAYLQIVGWEGPEADPYRDQAQARADSIIDMLGTPTPGP